MFDYEKAYDCMEMLDTYIKELTGQTDIRALLNIYDDFLTDNHHYDDASRFLIYETFKAVEFLKSEMYMPYVTLGYILVTVTEVFDDNVWNLYDGRGKRWFYKEKEKNDYIRDECRDAYQLLKTPQDAFNNIVNFLKQTDMEFYRE